MKSIIITILLSLVISTQAQMSSETYYIKDTTALMQKVSSSGQGTTIYKSRNGSDLPVVGTYRALTILVNIIYDQNPDADPYKNPSTVWMANVTNSINTHLPTYLPNLFDTDIQASYNGTITRIYAEASFNQLIMLSDYMVVNIKQSQITPNGLASFSYTTLMNSVINYINDNGGLNTIYGHNLITNYDFTSTGSYGVEKPLVGDSKIDILNFLIRNSTTTYGSVPSGNGYSGVSVVPSVKLKIGSLTYGYNIGTYQCVGDGNISLDRGVLGHEIAHYFLGGNEFHTSSANHNGDNYTNTFIGNQMGGYGGLFGGALKSCNGYERWRLGWYPPNYTYLISASSVNSDIQDQFQGEQTFTLRDFVTYGDVIRIKMPYKDNASASNQYIWLENHQSGKNNKFDGYGFIQETCRNYNPAGVFCYYQVGKDVVESTNNNLVYPINEKDNLRQISAEGNYDMTQTGLYNDCMQWAPYPYRPRFDYTVPNALQGLNDLTEAYKGDIAFAKLQNNGSLNYMGSKIKNGIVYDNFPWCGDDLDPFFPTETGVVMDISSNPSAINTTTYYSVHYGRTVPFTFNAVDSYRNTRKLYLTGLSIKMIDPNPSGSGMKDYTVKIRWDDYDVKQSVRWTGDIVLKEKLNLLQGKKVTLVQSLTPNQIDRDAVSGRFAQPTKLTCEANSILTLNSNSKVLLRDTSSLILQSNSSTIMNDAVLEIYKGSTLMIKSGANLNILGTGKIIVKQGGYLCVESGANINLQDYNSLVVLEEGAIIGANPLLYTSPNCGSTISSVGSGSIVDFNQDVYIQNQIISANKYIGGKNIFIGNHVTTTKTQGDVIINNGANVVFDGKTVTFDKGFECVSGSSFEQKNH